MIVSINDYTKSVLITAVISAIFHTWKKLIKWQYYKSEYLALESSFLPENDLSLGRRERKIRTIV